VHAFSANTVNTVINERSTITKKKHRTSIQQVRTVRSEAHMGHNEHRDTKHRGRISNWSKKVDFRVTTPRAAKSEKELSVPAAGRYFSPIRETRRTAGTGIPDMIKPTATKKESDQLEQMKKPKEQVKWKTVSHCLMLTKSLPKNCLNFHTGHQFLPSPPLSPPPSICL